MAGEAQKESKRQISEWEKNIFANEIIHKKFIFKR